MTWATMVASSSPRLGIMAGWEGWMLTCSITHLYPNLQPTPATTPGWEESLRVM